MWKLETDGTLQPQALGLPQDGSSWCQHCYPGPPSQPRPLPDNTLYIMSACCNRVLCRNCLIEASFILPRFSAPSNVILCRFEDCRKPANFAPLRPIASILLTPQIHQRAREYTKRIENMANDIVVDAADAQILLRKLWSRFWTAGKFLGDPADPMQNPFFSALFTYFSSKPGYHSRFFGSPHDVHKALVLEVDKQHYGVVCCLYPSVGAVAAQKVDDQKWRHKVLKMAMEKDERMEKLAKLWTKDFVETFVELLLWRFLERFETS